MNYTIAVMLTCYNRVNKTLKCLDALFSQKTRASMSVFLVDDGSTDGTGDAVREKYQQVHVLEGDGNLFWNRGMHLAYGEALKLEFDYYLWLNDDITIYVNTLDELVASHQTLERDYNRDCIIISSTRDPETKELTYGGYRQQAGIDPLKLQMIPPSDEPIKCDTFCGNCVLIPKQIAKHVGNIDPGYTHRWGDVDYGLRAKGLGFETWIAPGYLAECEANPMAKRWRDPQIALRERFRELHSTKGLGKRDWWKFVRRHGGALWFISGFRPYMRILYDTIATLWVGNLKDSNNE